MQDDWLLDVLREIDDYSVRRNLTWLIPLVEKAHLAAKEELIPRSAHRSTGEFLPAMDEHSMEQSVMCRQGMSNVLQFSGNPPRK